MVQGSGLTLEILASDIRARVTAGDRDAKRSDDHYKAAGILLNEAQARLRTEKPGTPWLTWVAKEFPLIKETRVSQLQAIGRGDITQAEISKAGYARAMASAAPPPPPPPEACRAKSTTTSATHSRHARERREAVRVANGGSPSKPRVLITPEYKTLTIEYRDIGARLGIDDLRAAISLIRSTFHVEG